MKNGNGANERGTGGQGAGVLDAERHVQAADDHDAGVQSVHALREECIMCNTQCCSVPFKLEDEVPLPALHSPALQQQSSATVCACALKRAQSPAQAARRRASSWMAQQTGDG